MAELKREVRGEIEANLVPPPQQNVWGEALKSVIQADASIQQSKLLKEQDLERDRQMNEGMQAQIETQEATNRRTAEAATVFGDPSSNIKKEEGAIPLSDADKRDLDEIRGSMKRNKDGMMQGATSHTESLINQELILKRAIQRRPWLRDEFIKASTGFLGVDVYQRGYMALAENEAARLTANDAAAKEKNKADDERGKAIRADGFVTDYLAANPDDIEGAQILARDQYDNAALARFYDERIGTPRGEAFRQVQAVRKGVAVSADFAKNSQTVSEAKTTEAVKKVAIDETTAFSKTTGDILNDKTLWGDDGTILPEKQPIAQARFDAMLLQVNAFEQKLIQGGASPEVAKSYGDMQRASIERVMDVLTGKTGEKLTQAQITRLTTEAQVGMLTQPAVAAVAVTLVKQGVTDKEMAQTLAFQMVGANGGNSDLILKQLTGPSAGNVATMIKEQAAILQDPAVTGNARAMAKDVLRSLGVGTVVNLSGLDAREMAKSYGAIGQARLQLEDWSRAFLATDNVGDGEKGTSFFESLGDTDKQNMGGAFAKSVYKIQNALVTKTALNSDLAAFRKNNEDGTAVLKFGADGSIIVVDQSAFNSPQEKAYLAEINQHNAFIKRSKAGEVIQSTLGRPPTNADRQNALATSFGVSGIAGANKLAISASRAAIYGRDEGGAGKKPQGAQAPIGTRVYKAEDQASRIGYAEGLRGAESGGNFNVQYGGKSVPVTDMTVGQVLAYQESQKSQGKQTAIGAYQFTQATLKDAMKRAGVPEDAKFTVATQNTIMRAHSNYLAETAKKALGRDPSYGEMYLLHFQGEGDGKAMLAAGPSAPIDAWFSEKEKALNPAYAKARTVGDLIAILEKKWS